MPNIVKINSNILFILKLSSLFTTYNYTIFFQDRTMRRDEANEAKAAIEYQPTERRPGRSKKR